MAGSRRRDERAPVHSIVGHYGLIVGPLFGIPY
jgi:hypothetical protein